MLARTDHIYCNRCREEREHSILDGTEKNNMKDDPSFPEITAWDRWEYCQCKSCGDIKIRRKYFCSEQVQLTPDNVHVNDGCSYEYHPPIEVIYINSSLKDFLENNNYYEHDLDWLLRETISAVNSGLDGLAMIGCRSLIEFVWKENALEPDSRPDFPEKLRELFERGLISEYDKIVFMPEIVAKGNDVAHKFVRPSKVDIKLAVMMAMNMLERMLLFPRAFKHEKA